MIFSTFKNRTNISAIFRSSLKLALLSSLLAFSSFASYGQYCRGSALFYIVRDAKGKIINPARLDAPAFIEEDVIEISYAEAEKPREGYWLAGETIKAARKDKFAGLDKETGSLFALYQHTGGACSFSKPITYKLTLGKKTMNLIFRFAAPQNDAPEVFLVDSLPFQQGTFEIQLPERTGNYEGENWRKTSDAADAPATITVHHIRGRVINAVTKRGIAGAIVRFRTSPPHYGTYSTRKEKSETRTDAKGRFAIERLRGDLLDQSSVAAVFIEHPDYVVNKYAEIFRPSEQQWREAIKGNVTAPFKSQDNLTIELTPLVTISGRVVDAMSDGNLPDAENLPKNFTVSVEYGEGGYLGGNLDIPRGKASVRPNPDGTFTLKTAPGKNKISASGTLGGKKYYLVGYSKEIQVDETGLKDLVLKIQADPRDVKR